MFDDGPRFARDRSSTDLPKGLAHLINTSGPRIQAGLLNTREAAPEWHDPAGPHWGSGPKYRDTYGQRPEQEPHDGRESHSGPGEWPKGSGQAWHPGDGINSPSHLHPAHGPYTPSPTGRIAASDGPRDHGGHGPDGGPSVPDWYYEDDNDNDGDPEDPPGTPMEDPWGHHAGSRRPFDRAASGRLAACLECGDDVLPREGDWEHVNGPSDHLADPDEDDIANDEYGEGLDPARGMDAYKQRREARLAQLSYEDVMKRIDEQLAAGEQNNEMTYVHRDPQFQERPRRDDWEPPPGWLAAGNPHQPGDPVRYRVNGERGQVSHVDDQNPGVVHVLWDGHGTPQEHWWSAVRPEDHFGHTAAAAVMDPTQMQVPLGGGYQPAHRVGLPWRDQVIPGTVIGLDGPNVNVRWDDGQYSIEEPHNIQLL